MSSSSSVCQGLQSCLEPSALRLKLARPCWSPSQPSDKEKSLTNTNDERDMKSDKNAELGAELGGWSFLQSLPSHCNKTEEHEAEKVYVHPTVKRSSSMLSAKSLEMCTESLGCETGGDSSDDISVFSSESSSSSFKRNTLVADKNPVSRRFNKAGNFPPPLTSITDLGGVQVRPHRQDGRLILEAVTSPSPQPYFQAERSDGRLRLQLFESFPSDEETGDEEGGNEEDEEEEEEAETEDHEACGEEDTNAVVTTGADVEECSDEEEEYMDNAEDETGMTKFARPSRCKESGNRDIFGDVCFERPSLSLCL